MPLIPDTNNSSDRLAPRLRSLLRSVFRVAAFVVAGFALVVIVFLLLLQLPFVASPVAQLALTLANPWEGTTATVSAAGGTWVTDLWLREVRISNPDGSLVIAIDSLGATYDPAALSRGELRFKKIRLIRPVVITGTTPQGDLEFLRPFSSTPDAEPDTSEGLRIFGGSVYVSLGAFFLHAGGDSTATTADISSVLIDARNVSIGRTISLVLDTLSATYRSRPDALESTHIDLSGEMADDLITVRSLQARSPRSNIQGSGTIALPFDTLFTAHSSSFRLDANPIAYNDLHPFVDALGPEGEASVHVTLERDSRHAIVVASGLFTDGGTFEATGSAEAQNAQEPGVRAEVKTAGVSIAAFTGRPDTSQHIDVLAHLVGHGTDPSTFNGTLTATLDARGLVGSRVLRASVEASLQQGGADLHGKGSLDALLFTLGGRLSAFADPPVYDLTTTAQIPLARGTPGSDDILNKLAGLNGTIRASGTGFNPLVGTCRANARIRWDGNPDVESLLVEATSGDSAAEARALLTTLDGSMRLDAQARVGSVIELVLRALEFSRLDLSALLGTQGAMSLTGTASGEVRGPDLEHASGSFSFRLDSSHVRTTRIARANIDARLENGLVTAVMEGRTNDGDINIRASAEPFAQRPSVTVQEATFQGLDVGGLLLDDDGATDLNGSVRLHLVKEPEPGMASGMTRAASLARTGLVGAVQVDLGHSRIYRQDLNSLAVAGELTGQVAVVELDLRTPTGGALFSGNVELFQDFPNARLTNGRFEHLDIGALAGIDSLDTDVSGTLSGELQGRSWEAASGSIALDLLPSRINREPVSEARVTADVTNGDVSLRGYAALRAGLVNLAGSGSLRDDQLSFNADVDLDLHDLSRLTRDSSLASSNAHVRFAAKGIWGAPGITQVDGRLYASGSLDSLRLDSLVAVLAVAGRIIEVDSLLVRSNAGMVQGAGTIALLDTTGGTESDFRLNASLASLHRLRRVTGLGFSHTGSARISASLTGTGRSGKLDFSTDIANLGMEDVLIPALKVQGGARLGAGPHVEAMSVEAMASDLAIGELVFDSVAAIVKTNDSVSSFRSSLVLESGEQLAFAGTGERLGDRYAITLDSLALNMGYRLWLLEHPARIEVGKGLRIDDLSLSSGPRRLMARGTLDPEGQQDFHLQIDSLAFDRLARFLGRPNLGGELSFNAVVTGPADHARATGRLDAHITSNGKPVGTVESDAEWTAGLMKVTSIVKQPDQSQLKAVVSLPASLPFVSGASPTKGPADSTVDRRSEFLLQTDGFDLKFLEPFFNSQALPEPHGLLTADLALRGQAVGFSGTGHLGIDTAFARVTSIGVEYSNIHLEASLEGPNLVIDSLSARTGAGGVSASGTVSLASLEDPAFDLVFKPHKFLGINTQTMRAVADGSLTVAGTLKLPVITGDITIDEANFVVPETVSEGQVESVQLTDADYAILRERFGYRRQAPGKSGAGDTTRVSLDVALHFPRRSWIRKKANPSLSVEIEGDLKVRSMPGEPLSLVGVLKPVAGRSFVSQFGRQFEIKSGEIRFDGPPEQFNLNVDSEYKVPARSGSGMSEATIRMQVERRLERFQFTLSSDPPMEQADILSYLTTGTATSGAFASTSSQGNLATSAALEQVVGAIGGLAEDKIPLDIFQIRQDGARGITIVAGNYVSPKTYVGVRYPILLQQTGQDNYYDTGTEFEVEYQSFPWLFWNAKGGSTRLMLLLKSRYAY